MSEELPTIATKDAVCHIDFEFQLAYDAKLASKETLQECIFNAVNDILITIDNNDSQSLQLKATDIDIPEIDLRPNESTPKRIKIGGWITCKDRHRQIYMDALQSAQRGRKISAKLADATGIKKTKILLSQFATRFSNAHHVNKSFIDGTEEDFHKFQKRTTSLQNTEQREEENNQQQQPSVNDGNENNENKEDDEEEPPLTSLNEGSQSVVVNDMEHDETVEVVEKIQEDPKEEDGNDNHEDEVEEEYVDLISKQESTDNNDSSFQMVDGLDTMDQSSNEEQKTPERAEKDNLLLNVAETNDGDLGGLSGDDFTNVTPRMPGVDTSFGSSAGRDDEVEVIRLKKEVAELKRKHAEEMTLFNNRLNTLKREKESNVRRQKRTISMQIDEDIVNKEIVKQRDDKVLQLENELKAKQTEQNLSIQQLQLQHQTELQKFDYKLRQTQQLHSLELNNIRGQHKFEVEQLQTQIRALTGSLERESQKDRKIHELTEENEQLKADKERTAQNYDMVITRLNNDSEENIKNEIDKRVKETAQLRREINELKQTMKREKARKEQLEREVNQLQNQNEEKDRFISQLQSMYQREKAKASKLQTKITKSKRDIFNHTKEDKQAEKDKKIIDGGGHVRKPSKGLVGRTVTVSKLDTGDKMIEIEKNKEFDMNDLQNTDIGAYDPELDFTDDEFDDDENDGNKKMMAEDEHNQEIALKNQQIEQLKETISNLEANIEAQKVSTNEELQASHHKIGSLQQKIEQEQENFMKQNQMLQFKLKKKEGDLKNIEEQLHDLRYSHKREIRNLSDEIEKQKQETVDKDATILSLEQNVDMLQQENDRLRQYEEDIELYEADIQEIDEHYTSMLDEMERQNAEAQGKLNDVLHQTKEENKTLKTTVHHHRETITELKTLLQNMKQDEINMAEKEQRLQDIRKERSGRDIRDSRQSRELDEADVNKIGIDFTASSPSPIRVERVERKEDDINDNDDDNNRSSQDMDMNDQWKGQGQAEPQPDSEPETPSLGHNTMTSNLSNLSDYILKEEMDQLIQSKLDDLTEKLKMKHALQIDTVESKNKQKYDLMQQELNENLNQIKSENNSLKNQIQELKQKITQTEQDKQQQIMNSEQDRIKLLQNFMKEMDRMRQEIKKLHGIKVVAQNKRRY